MIAVHGKNITLYADPQKAKYTVTLAGGDVWSMDGRPCVELTDGSVWYLDEAACVSVVERRTGVWHGVAADYTLSCGITVHTLVYIENIRDDL